MSELRDEITNMVQKIVDEPLEIENDENIFEPEESKEKSFEELLDGIPEPVENMLRAMKTLMDPLTQPIPMPALAWPAQPERIYKVQVLPMSGMCDAQTIEKTLGDTLNAGWTLGDRIAHVHMVVCIFWRDALQLAAKESKEE